MVVTCQQMREAEEAAFARGISAAQLMEQAGAGIAEVIRQFFPQPAHTVLYLGKGNNAGDALVAARHLAAAGWTLHARLAFPVEAFKELPARHWKALGDKIQVADSMDDLMHLPGTVVLLDGLVGIGVTGALRGPLGEAVREMNQLRRLRHAVTVAMDLPSGLDPATGDPADPCVQADLTATVGGVKDMLLADAATIAVGRLAVVPLRELDGEAGDASSRVLTAPLLLPVLPKRPFEFHKGQAGRVGIIAGSRGFLGAAVLASSGALRGGAGLVTLLVKEDAYALMASLTPPEIMVKAVKDYREVLDMRFDALAIGPGLGSEFEDEVLDVIRRSQIPAVLDADALNMISRHGFDSLSQNQTPRLLTPHPGEMARLVANAPAWADLDRAATVRQFSAAFPQLTILLKGARTVIATAGHPLSFNSTGHPGMASGGMGDTLTGLCAALIGQGVSTHDAACLGAWLSGRAAELAVVEGAHCSEESLSASDVLAHLGAAFADLRRLAW
jgi:ADP-dependent NAD(P)H-hydrate dehydratase / NAD(P)H-hydrate epimerase